MIFIHRVVITEPENNPDVIFGRFYAVVLYHQYKIWAKNLMQLCKCGDIAQAYLKLYHNLCVPHQI